MVGEFVRVVTINTLPMTFSFAFVIICSEECMFFTSASNLIAARINGHRHPRKRLLNVVKPEPNVGLKPNQFSLLLGNRGAFEQFYISSPLSKSRTQLKLSFVTVEKRLIRPLKPFKGIKYINSSTSAS